MAVKGYGDYDKYDQSGAGWSKAVEQGDSMAKAGISQEETDKILDQLANEKTEVGAIKQYPPADQPITTRDTVALESIALSLKRLADRFAPAPKRPVIVDSAEILTPRRAQP